jgi:hypothetical protein
LALYEYSFGSLLGFGIRFGGEFWVEEKGVWYLMFGYDDGIMIAMMSRRSNVIKGVK